MEGMRYSRQNYNELKRRQYGEYNRNQNKYFLYMKNYYEEYIRKQNKQYLDMKQYYEEYIKNQNKQYLSMMKYYEELKQKQDDDYKNLKIDYEEKLNYYTDFIDNKRNTYLSDSYKEESKNSYNEVNIDDNNKKSNSEDKPYELLETSEEDCNLEYKNNSVGEYNNLENTCYNDEKDSINNEEIIKYTILEDNKDIYVKFPIILAETNIAVTIDDTMKVGRDVKEIRRIKMNAFFKSSNLVPISLKNSEANSGMLFVSGFIRKSVEYATRTFIEERKEDNCGYIKYCIVEVPFNFTTKITFIRPAVFIENCNVRDDSSCDTNKVYNANEDSIILCDNCNENFLSTEVFNEKPFVELVKANFIEFNINKELHLKEDEEIQETYTKFKGNIIVNLRIRVLQEQDLRVEIEKD